MVKFNVIDDILCILWAAKLIHLWMWSIHGNRQCLTTSGTDPKNQNTDKTMGIFTDTDCKCVLICMLTEVFFCSNETILTQIWWSYVTFFKCCQSNCWQ